MLWQSHSWFVIETCSYIDNYGLLKILESNKTNFATTLTETSADFIKPPYEKTCMHANNKYVPCYSLAI